MRAMGEFLFGSGPGHLSDRADEIARRYGACLVNYVEPRGERRHWFAGPNRGNPFDQALAAQVLAALAAEGLLEEEEES